MWIWTEVRKCRIEIPSGHSRSIHPIKEGAKSPDLIGLAFEGFAELHTIGVEIQRLDDAPSIGLVEGKFVPLFDPPPNFVDHAACLQA